MGQAKRRGTFEERRAKAIAKQMNLPETREREVMVALADVPRSRVHRASMVAAMLCIAPMLWETPARTATARMRTL